MRPVLGVAEMREADRRAAAGLAPGTLVQRAGSAVGRAALDMLGGTYGRRVVVVAGPGNNGADGRVAARWLERRGAAVAVVDAAAPGALPACDLVIDAAFGTGFHGRYEAPLVPPGAAVLAVDIPSGVNGDTGAACEGAVLAQRTITFAALKPGLVLGEGRWRAGEVSVADIGVDPFPAAAHLVEDSDVAAMLPRRAPEAHKWQSALVVVAGSAGMAGAARFVASAAGRAGAGIVRLGSPGFFEPEASEAVTFPLGEQGWQEEAASQARRAKALVVGPGLGRSPATSEAVAALLAATACPAVVDADGINALESPEALAGIARKRGAAVVLTPHEGEYGRFAGTAVGTDRIAAAKDLARRSASVVLLKGSSTVVASPDERVLISVSGSSRLASAGTGDVLSGIIGAFLARGVPAQEAAALAAHVHGRAAGLGPEEGLLAGDLPGLVSAWLSAMRRG